MLRTTTIFTGLQGAPYYSTHYWGGTEPGEADAVVAALAQFWTDTAPQRFIQLVGTIQGEVEVVDPATGQVTAIYNTDDPVQAGTNTTTQLSGATQGLLRWRTGVFVGGREMRGRTFLPGPTEGLNDNGNPSGPYQGAYTTAAEALILAAPPSSGLVVYSPTHRQFAAVQAASTWNRWAVTRSRRD